METQDIDYIYDPETEIGTIIFKDNEQLLDA